MIKDVIKARAWNWRADNNRISNSITKHINNSAVRKMKTITNALFSFGLPVQGWVLHLSYCIAWPSLLQLRPPFAGGGLVHERERFWMPVPQVKLHEDQAVHSE